MYSCIISLTNEKYNILRKFQFPINNYHISKKEKYMATGKIKWFNARKGFGFIQNDAGGKDVFLHISALEESGIESLNEGDAVSFEVGESKGKEKAIEVKKI